ncbi:SRPBCC family protein [Ramlibacter sp. XY19]|uniref:CoxG family protein n=1 Tax=Ramlibacter paludis TaxID=2908000 RepID=UPI0023D9CFE0|nr:SRPBCC family protein [Ramlibacter paludis]MCG2594268.1 SRPBCC family protein [Ramlibacter paludis]
MEIEKTLDIPAPAARVWELLLDPQVMGRTVPGMQSIEVVSPTEYKALMAVKIAFVSAKFKLKTTIVEQRAPHYLRAEGTGEDASVASSLKQQSEMFLGERADGTTELRIKVKVDVLGRLGSFGLSVMKTKADRMWDEFGQNLVRELGPKVEAPSAPAPAPAKVEAVVVEAPNLQPAAPGWLQRLLAGLSRRRAPANERSIRIEIQREGTTVTVHWPLEAANECAALLKELMRA